MLCNTSVEKPTWRLGLMMCKVQTASTTCHPASIRLSECHDPSMRRLQTRGGPGSAGLQGLDSAWSLPSPYTRIRDRLRAALNDCLPTAA